MKENQKHFAPESKCSIYLDKYIVSCEYLFTLYPNVEHQLCVTRDRKSSLPRILIL